MSLVIPILYRQAFTELLVGRFQCLIFVFNITITNLTAGNHASSPEYFQDLTLIPPLPRHVFCDPNSIQVLYKTAGRPTRCWYWLQRRQWRLLKFLNLCRKDQKQYCSPLRLDLIIIFTTKSINTHTVWWRSGWYTSGKTHFINQYLIWAVSVKLWYLRSQDWLCSKQASYW